MNNSPINPPCPLIALLITVFLPISSAQAADQLALANAKGCLACHAIDKPSVGPSVKAIAAKYAGGAESAKLVKNVLNGSVDVWGSTPGPASKVIGLSEADAKKLVDWMLGYKPK